MLSRIFDYILLPQTGRYFEDIGLPDKQEHFPNRFSHPLFYLSIKLICPGFFGI